MSAKSRSVGGLLKQHQSRSGSVNVRRYEQNTIALATVPTTEEVSDSDSILSSRCNITVAFKVAY
jgi:hypothetical protein